MGRAGARYEQVMALLGEGRVDQALASARRLVQSAPNDPAAAVLMAHACESANQLVQAMTFAERAAGLLPGDAGVQLLAGRLAGLLGEPAKAEAFLRRAIAIDPLMRDARQQLAQLYAESHRVSDVEALARDGLAVTPDDPAMRSMLAGAMLNGARADEGARILRELRDTHPNEAVFASGYAMMLNYASQATPPEVFEAHRRYGEIMDRVQPSPRVTYTNARDVSRRLRVGIISPDLRAHSVAWFAEPLLRHYDRAALEMIVYQTNFASDGVTQRLKPLADVWRVMDTATDAALAQRVHDDRVDVLIELSGHTAAGSLLTMQLRPAPVSMTYLGYPNTTGLRAIDARLVDSITDPAGSEAFASERLLRLDPCFLCYQPPGDAPAPAPRGEGLTFGSFNSAQKLNHRVVMLWSRVLGAAPGSRLVLKSVNFADAPLRARVREWFEQAGVDAGRVDILEPVKERAGHLSAYARIDVALDPVPYNGTTTTCEALWMGVPVVTLRGTMHAGRVGASLLSTVGLSACVAESEDEYVRIASALVGDAAHLAGVRRGLRERVATSALCDGPGFCRRFERAVRGAWTTWVHTQGA